MTLRLLLLCALCPLVLLVCFQTTGEIRDLTAHARTQAQVSAVALESEKVSDLVHALQKERGFSAGFASSKGTRFGAELAAQREETDAALAALDGAIPGISGMAPEAISAALAALSVLGERRTEVDARDMSVTQLATYYTGAINNLLDASHRIRLTLTQDDSALMIEAAELLALAKESAGRERAMGVTLVNEAIIVSNFGDGAIPPEVHQSFVALGGEQMGFLARAEKLLGRSDLSGDLLSTPSAEAVARMRAAIGALAYGGRLNGLQPTDWFNAATGWIDELRALEATLARDLADLTAARAERAQGELWRTGLILGLGLLAVAGFAFFLTEMLTRKLRRLIAIMSDFVHGRFEAEVPMQTARGEVGEMARAIARFKDLSQAALDQRAREKAQLHARHQEVVRLMTDGLEALARADLSLSFDAPLASEYDNIRRDFNTASARLREVVGAMSTTVADLESSAATMRGSASDLAERTTTQVSTIGETADTVSDLAVSLTETTESLKTAKDLAGEARERANRSGEVMRNAVDAMDRISTSSHRIAQITSVIEDISFQTNLLALNAGVEAARAGESGKGFAVVAQEVRALASRSSAAALEIKKLIDESVREVTGGVTLVGETGAALEEILGRIQRVDDVLTDVSTSAENQNGELQGLNGAMSRLSELTARNTAVADASRDAASELARHAQELRSMVSEFTLEDATTATRARAA